MAATDCVSQSRCSMLEFFFVWVCDIFKFTSLKTFTPIPVTFWEPYLIYWIYLAFWIESFTETWLGQSIFGVKFHLLNFCWHFGLKPLLKHRRNIPFLRDQMDLFKKKNYIPSIPLNLVSKTI